MKKKYLIMVLFLFCFVLLTGCNQKNYMNEVVTRTIEYEDNITLYDIEDAIVEATKKAEQSIVGVEASSGISSGFGSGVIVKKTELSNLYTYYVITNFHVISHNNRVCSKLAVYIGDYDETYTATCVDYSKEIDIAVLRFTCYRNFTPATIGDSTTYQKGRYAIAIGNPYDLKTFYNSVTVGNVSNPCRECIDDNNVLNYYIQHTAAINGGNSGGGLFDLHGNLMGINTWKYAEVDIEGMGFSVPIHIVKAKFSRYF